MFGDSTASVLNKMKLPYTLHEESRTITMYLVDVVADGLPLHGGITKNDGAEGKHLSISFFFAIKNTTDELSILKKINELNNNGNVGTFIYDTEENSLVYSLIIPRADHRFTKAVFEFYMMNMMIVFRDNKECLMQF